MVITTTVYYCFDLIVLEKYLLQTWSSIQSANLSKLSNKLFALLICVWVFQQICYFYAFKSVIYNCGFINTFKIPYFTVYFYFIRSVILSSLLFKIQLFTICFFMCFFSSNIKISNLVIYYKNYRLKLFFVSKLWRPVYSGKMAIFT